MIDLALQFLVSELNSYMLARTGSELGRAALGRLVDDSGRWAVGTDQLGVALLNIEEERALKAQTPESVLAGGRSITVPPPLRVNLHVMVAANFQAYAQGLRQLSYALTFFQAHPVFVRGEYPGLDARIDRLAVDLMSLSFEQLNQMWAFVGGKQLPGVVYRVRLIALQDVEPDSIQPPVTTIVTETRGR